MQSSKNSSIVSFDELEKFTGVTALGVTNNRNYAPFMACTNLKSVVLPVNAAKLYRSSFENCSSLENLVVDWSKISIIEQDTFKNCASLAIEDLSLPNLETLCENALYGVSIKKISNLGKITALPVATTSGQNFGRKDVLEEVVLPETVTDIPANSFAHYTALSKYNLSHVKTISSAAFSNTPYKDVVDLSSIVTLNDSAIDSTKWGKIIIGENCTTINQYNFWRFKSTPMLIVRAVTPPSLAGNNNMNFCSVIYVPDESVTAYREASGWSTYADRIFPISYYDVRILTYNEDGNNGYKLYKISEYDTAKNDYVMGIAVNTDNWSGVVAINNQGNTVAWSTAYALNNSYASSDTTLYNGREITVTAAVDGVNAPKIANDYTFVNGQTGYLPSYIEAEILSNRMVAINDAITKVGGTTITEAWTCAKPGNSSDSRRIYTFGVDGIVYELGVVLYKSYVRPVTEFPEGLEW